MAINKREAANWRSSLFLFAGFVGVASAAASVAFGWITTDRGWLLLAASGIALVASQLDRITEISAGGATAKLQQKIQEADEAVEHVRALAATLAQPTMKMAVRLGRWDSQLSKRETYDFRLKIEATLKELGAPADEISAAVRSLVSVASFASSLFSILGGWRRSSASSRLAMMVSVPEMRPSIASILRVSSGWRSSPLSQSNERISTSPASKLLKIVSSIT